MKRYKPELNFGLDEVQVQERFSEGFYNKEASRKTKSVPQILKENTCTLFNLVNLVLAIFITKLMMFGITKRIINATILFITIDIFFFHLFFATRYDTLSEINSYHNDC